MPDGPEGMSEPQYASLAFDHICDVSFISMTDFFPINEMDITRAVESPCPNLNMAAA